MCKFLLNKKVLFIGIGFYDYDKAIVEKLTEFGYDVTYFWSSITNFQYKVLRRLYLGKLAEKYLQNLRTKAIHQLTKNNDIVFIIKGENLTQEDIDLIKQDNLQAKYILYLWDDIKRIRNKELLLNNFNNIWSFDSEDCKKYGFRFRPLFFRENLTPQTKDIYLSSIGWCHSSRLRMFRKVAKYLKSNNKSYVLKLYTGAFNYFYNRFLSHRFSSFDQDLLITKPVDFKQTIEIMSRSRFVLDLPHPSQKGLTIRTIEALRCGCHIITTNKSISDYQDISKDNYTIIKPEIDNLDYLNAIPIGTPSIGERYSLTSFIQELFEIR